MNPWFSDCACRSKTRPKVAKAFECALAACGLFAGGSMAADALVLVESGRSLAPVMVAADAPAETLEAARDLVDHLEWISGAKPALLEGAPEPAPEPAIWVGLQPGLASLFPDVDFSLRHPEEILLVCDGRNLAIVGRDRAVDGQRLESGTAHAVSTFMQDYLGVRWLMPRWTRPADTSFWTDWVPRETIALEPFVHRFHPPFRQRVFHGRGMSPVWYRRQRIWHDSFAYRGGHAFTDWWEKYHQEHPGYFALRADGTRTPERWGRQPNLRAVKLCLSNPAVAEQWLKNAAARLEADPSLMMLSASPNDGGGFCVCDDCRAWDHPDAPAGVLTERYVKFWNILARGLRERFPDREVWIGAYAYSAYRTPPIEETLDPRIAIGYVGHFPLAGDAATAREKAAWLGWAEKATQIIYRPNLFHYSGGWLGLPTIATRRTIDDFRFLAEHKGVGIEIDSLSQSWATQGVQMYLMAQLTYNPLQDADALLADYYRRGFGPAADAVEGYFNLMESAHEQILNHPDFRHSSGAARGLVAICEAVYTDALLDQADAWLLQAEASTAEASDLHRDRVAYVRGGLDVVRAQVGVMRVMRRVRESGGSDREAVEKAITLCETRDELIRNNGVRFPDFYRARVPDHLGPPSEAFRQAAGLIEEGGK